MNKLNALNTEAQTQIICGRTEVIVKKRTVNEGGREKIETIHKGIVLQQTNEFLRVYNPLPTSKGGDTAPEHCEWFPRASNACWCEVTATRPEDRAMTIPPIFR